MSPPSSERDRVVPRRLGSAVPVATDTLMSASATSDFPTSDFLVAKLDPLTEEAFRAVDEKRNDDHVGERILEASIFLRQGHEQADLDEAEQHAAGHGAGQRTESADDTGDEGLQNEPEAEVGRDAAAPRDDEHG